MMSEREFNDQFRETPGERNECLRESRHKRTIETLQTLIYDMSGMLTDEGDDLTDAGLAYFRQRVADALGPKCPEWLAAKTNTILDTAKLRREVQVNDETLRPGQRHPSCWE